MIGMASERKFYWFGLSISTPGSAENRKNRLVRADETQSIGDLVTQELESMTPEFKIDKIDASKSLFLMQPLLKTASNVVLYNDFGMRYIYSWFKKKTTEKSSSTDLPNGLQYLMGMQRKYDRLPSQRYSTAILCTSHLYPLPPPSTRIGGDNDFSTLPSACGAKLMLTTLLLVPPFTSKR